MALRSSSEFALEALEQRILLAGDLLLASAGEGAQLLATPAGPDEVLSANSQLESDAVLADAAAGRNGTESADLFAGVPAELIEVDLDEAGGQYTLSLDPADPTSLRVSNDASGQELLRGHLSAVSKLVVSGSDQADDTLTIDFSLPFWLPGGITYQGGAGWFDSLILRSASDLSIQYSPVGENDGTMRISDGGHAIAIAFTGLEPVSMIGGASYTFNTGNAVFVDPPLAPPPGVDVINIDSPAPGQNRISGTVGGKTFEAVTFSNVGAVTIDTGANDTDTANADRVMIDSSGLVAAGLANWTILTGPGDDEVTINGADLVLPASGGGVVMDMGEGTDRLVVKGSAGADSFELFDDTLTVNVGWLDLPATESVRIEGLGGDDTFDLAPSPETIVAASGGTGTDTLNGPVEGRIIWRVTGSGSGDVGGMSFDGFENLAGASDTATDLFVFDANGSLAGTVAGGTGAGDGIEVQDAAGGSYTVFNPASVDSSGTLALHGKTIAYSGMDGQVLLTGDNVSRVLRGTVFDDHMVLEDADATLTGQMRLRFPGTNVYDGTSFISELLFSNPSSSLTIAGLEGNDEFEVTSLDAMFTGTLLVDGGEGDNALIGANSNTNWTVTGEGTGTVGRVGFTGMDALVGGAATDTIYGAEEDTDWALTGPGAGMSTQIRFSGTERVVGGSVGDNFKVYPAATMSLGVDGGSGDDRLEADEDTANTFGITGANAGMLNGTLSFSSIENLAGGRLNDTFVLGTDGSLSGMVDGGPDEGGEEAMVDMVDYSQLNQAVTIDLATGAASLLGGQHEIDAYAGSSASGSHGDTVVGPSFSELEWTITGSDTFTVAGISFLGFENLSGQPNNVDAFIIEAGGSVSGLVNGGAGGSDAVLITPQSGEGKIIEVTAPDSGGSTKAADYGKVVAYAGLDPQEIVDASDLRNPVISGTALADTIHISNDAGALSIRRGSTIYTIDAAQLLMIDSVRIEGKAGADAIYVDSVPAGFEGDLLIYGSSRGPVPLDEVYEDSVTFTGNVQMEGWLDVWADSITVNAGVSIAVGEHELVLRARRIGIAEAENLSPVIGTDRRASLIIGEGAHLSAENIILIAQAEDKALADEVGAPKEVDNYVIQPFFNEFASLIALPVKVMVKNSTATITLGADVVLRAEGSVGIYATASTDATGVAKSTFSSIGYAQGKAHAEVTLNPGVEIDALDAVTVTATGEATAKMTAQTERELKSFFKPLPGVAVALGVAYADTYSHVTVAEGATITAGKTVNVRASGDVKAEAEGETGIFASGKAGLAFGLEFSTADIHTQIDGAITARADSVRGSAVKLEIDPTVGLDAEGKPEIGYVDYANDRIYVGPNALVTEDTVVYENRRGASIGNLVNGRKYFVISLGDGWIQLAGTEADLLRSNPVDLNTTLGQASTNRKSFADTKVDAEADTITLERSDTGFNTFELGQPVVFRAGAGSQIPGLVPGRTYYVIATSTEQDLQGDSRLAERQNIRLAETENEAYAGVGMDLGQAVGTDFTLVGLHVLDPGFAKGIGVTAKLEAETEAAANAGLKSEDAESDPNDKKSVFERWDRFWSLTKSDVLDKIFAKYTERYNEHHGKPQAGASAKLAVSAALAFSYADHDVGTDVGASAVLKSNEELEVTSTIAHEYKLSAESSTEPQAANPKDPDQQKSAKYNISAAVSVGVIANSAWTTVAGGAWLDALRGLRVISRVTYPLLQRLDTYVPLSWSELEDALRSGGPEVVTQYIDSTLGVKDAFFNVWTAASSAAEELGFSGSVTVLVFTNKAETVIKNGAWLNQDAAWRDNMLNPHENQDNEAGADRDGAEAEQLVSVESFIAQQTITMTGVSSLPDLPTIDATDLNKTRKSFSKFGSALNPTGTRERTGAGGAIFISVGNDTSHAMVEDGARIYSGADGGFLVKAREAMLNVNLAQSYARGRAYAIGGTVLYAGQTTDTLAQLGSAAIVTGRNARVLAIDQSTVATWAGGIAFGDAFGLGLSVAVNDFSRQTRALVGVESNPGEAIASTTSIQVNEGVEVEALVNGDLWAFTVAGTVVVTRKPPKPSAVDAPKDPFDDYLALYGELNGAIPGADQDQAARTGVAIAAAAGANLVDDFTEALVADAGHVKAGWANVEATNTRGIISATGTIAFAKTKDGTRAVSLAGAFSWNEVNNTTVAGAQDTAFTLTGGPGGLQALQVRAENAPSIIAVASGDAGAVAASWGGEGRKGRSVSVAIAGSATVNSVSGGASASINHSTATIQSGPAQVLAFDESEILSVAGGLSLAFARGKQGTSTAIAAGVQMAVNFVSAGAAALVKDTTLTWSSGASGDFTIHSERRQKVEAYTMAAAVAGASGNLVAGKGVGGAGAGSGSYNEVDGGTTAHVVDSTITSCTGLIAISATDATTMNALAGGIALAIGVSSQALSAGVAFGAAFAANVLRYSSEDSDDVVAEASGATTLTSGAGAILLAAESSPTLWALALGVAAAGSGSTSGTALAGSLAGSLAYNKVRRKGQARLAGGARASAQGVITVHAADASRITGDAGGADLAVAISKTESGAFTLSVGAALAINDVEVNLTAEVNAASVTRGAGLSVHAESDSRVRSITFVGSAAVAGGRNGYSIAGAGAGSGNYIDNVVTATITASTVTLTSGTVSVTARDDSEIDADAASAAAAFAKGRDVVSFGIVFGAGMAFTQINDTITAEINASTINSKAGVLVEATSSADIRAYSFGLGGQAGGGANWGIFIAAAGAGSGNLISGSNTARVVGSTVEVGGDLTVQAVDDATIVANSAGGSLTVAALSETGVALAVGVSVAINEIDNLVTAVVESTTLTGINTLTIKASTSGVVDAVSVAAVLSISAGNTTNVAVSGGGAEADNYVGTDVTAYAKGSEIPSARVVQISALEGANVSANILAAAAIGTIGTGHGGGASIGVSVARNFIGPSRSKDPIQREWSTDHGLPQGATLAVGNRVYIDSGPRAGDVYVYGGPNRTQPTATYTASNEHHQVTIKPGEIVAVASSFPGYGTIESLYKYLGATATIDLATADFTVGTLWQDVRIDLRNEDYGDSRVWTQFYLTDRVASVQAYAEDCAITGAGSLTIEAETTQRVDSIVAAAAVALAGGGKTSVGISVGGVTAYNRIAMDVDAYILGAKAGLLSADTISIVATDASGINAIAGAGSIAGGFGRTAGVGMAVGFSKATNEVDVDVRAYIKGVSTGLTTKSVTVRATSSGQPDWQIKSMSGTTSGVTIVNLLDDAATQDPDDPETNDRNEGQIDAAHNETILESLRQAFAAASVTLNGALSLTTTEQGKRWLLASAEGDAHVLEALEPNAIQVSGPSIKAVSTAASFALTFGKTTGFAVSGGGAGAENSIGSKTCAFVESTQITCNGDVILDAAANATIVATVISVSLSVGVSATAGIGIAIGATDARNLIGATSDGAEVEAYVLNSAINAQGDLTIKANGDQDISAVVAAGSGALGISPKVAVSVSVPVAFAANEIGTRVSAHIDWTATISPAWSVRARSILIRAVDSATINVIAASASLSGAFGIMAAGVAVSVGAGIGRNTITGTVTASIFGVAGGVTSTSGSVELSAQAIGSITVTAVAPSVALAGGQYAGVAISGGGADAGNVILTSVDAYVDTSSVTSAADLRVSASQTPSITATVVGASAAVGGSVYAGVGVSVGSATSRNFIGYDLDKTRRLAPVRAWVNGSSIQGKLIDLDATADPFVDASVKSFSAALGVGAGGAGVTGAGVGLDNRVAMQVLAYIQGASNVQASTITLTARDASDISATGMAVSASASVGVVTGSAAIGVAVVDNLMTTDVNAWAAGSTLTTTGNVSVEAEENATLVAKGQPAAASAALSAGFALSGGGAEVSSTVGGTTSAFADKSTLTLSGALEVTARHTVSASAEVDVYTISVGMIAIAATGAVTEVTVAPNLTAAISESTVHAVSILVSAEEKPYGSSISDSLTISPDAVGAAVGVSKATTEVSPVISSAIGGDLTAGSLTVVAQQLLQDGRTTTAYAHAEGSTGGSLLGVDASSSTATGNAQIKSAVEEGAHLHIGGVKFLPADVNATADTITIPSHGFTSGQEVVYFHRDAGAIGNLTDDTRYYVIPVDANTLKLATTAANASAGVAVDLNLTGATTTAMHSLVRLTDDLLASVSAKGKSSQSAITNNAFGGILAGGAATSTATSGGTTSASVGANVVFTGGSISVSASGEDLNAATSTSGSGGLVSGNAAIVSVSDTASVATSLGNGATFAGREVNLNATHVSEYDVNADSANGAVVGGNGAVVTTKLSPTVSLTLGSLVMLDTSGAVLLLTQSRVAGGAGEVNANAGAGGVVYGSAATIDTRVTGKNDITLGDAVVIDSGLDPIYSPGDIRVSASTTMSANDVADNVTGGAISGAGSDAATVAVLDNTIDLGTNGKFTSAGDFRAGTYTTVAAAAYAEVSTYGVVFAVGVSRASADITSNQTVKVGSRSFIEALGNVELTAGKELVETSLNGVSSAQGVIWGLFTAPSFSADTTLVSNTTLSIAAGAEIRSVLDVIAGGFPGIMSPVADGTVTYYEVLFFPKTKDDDSFFTSSTGTVTIDGSITAGIYHDLAITIPNSKNYQGFYASTFDPVTGGAPFAWQFDPAFKAHDYVTTHFPGTSLLDEISTIPVGAMTLDGLYAAGGSVNLSASSISGAGSVTAYGGPSINLINESPDYLIVGAARIPNAPGGQVTFTGGASPGTLTVAEIDRDVSPEIIVTNAYQGPFPVGDSSSGPALFLMGAIENLAGLVSVTNLTGSLGQGSTISARQIDTYVPNGSAVYNLPPPDPVFAGPSPYADWLSRTASDPAWTDADLAIAYVVNAIYNPTGAFTTANALTAKLIGHAGDAPGGISHVYYGNSVPWVGVIKPNDSSHGTAVALSPAGGAYNISSGGTDEPGWFASVPVEQLTTSILAYPADLLTLTNSAIRGRQISIKALYVDISGQLVAGKDTHWSVLLPPTLKVKGPYGLAVSLYTYRDAYEEGLVARTVSLPVRTLNAGETVINAVYDAEANQITLEAVNASCVGGTVSIEGGIISTNPLGKIRVNGELGRVEVNNQTGIPLVLQDIFLGEPTGESTVEITDTLQSSATNHWLYVYRPGQGTSTYHGAASATLGNSDTFVGQVAGSSVTYQPTADLRWQWTLTASLTREVKSVDMGDYYQWTVGDWTWKLPSTLDKNPWTYVDASSAYSGIQQGQLITKAGLPVFLRSISGSSVDAKTWYVHYHNGHYGFARDGTSDADGENCPWYYSFPGSATITMTSSVKADNPVGIDFGAADGLISVISNASVILSGTITNPAGATFIQADGSITNPSLESILARDLTLVATQEIGTVTAPIKATLSADGVLDVGGGSAGVNLELGSGALVSRAWSQTGTQYGDVVIRASGDLVRSAKVWPPGIARVTGSNITIENLLGAVGSLISPLEVLPYATVLSNGETRGGILTVTALKDIGLRLVAGDARIKSVESLTGDVLIEVDRGNLYSVTHKSLASSLNTEQTAMMWNRLHLTSATGAEANAQATVVAFERSVESNYNEYWRLRKTGSVVGTFYTPNAASLYLYRARTAAALHVSQPTDEQVRSYTQRLYFAVLAFFDNVDLAADSNLGLPAVSAPLPGQGPLLGANWRTSSDFLNYNAAFSFHATQTQASAVTENAVWTEAQLTCSVHWSALASPLPQADMSGAAIIGRNVTLNVSGSIGRLSAPIEVSLADLQSGLVTEEQSQALAMANAPGSVMILARNNATGAALKLTYDQSVSLKDQVTVTGVEVARTEAFFISASGRVSQTAGGSAYICSTGLDFTIQSLSAPGDLSLTIPGNVSMSNATVQVGGSFVLAANGDVTISNSNVLASQNLTISTDKSLSVSGGALNATVGSMSLIAGDQLSILGSTCTAALAFALTSENGFSSNANTTLRSTTGLLTLEVDMSSGDPGVGGSVVVMGHWSGSQVKVLSGADDDSITIDGSLTPSALIQAGDGADSIHVRKITASTELDAGAGNDTINLSSAAPLAGGNVNGITGFLLVDGQTGTDTLNVDDSGDTVANNGTLSGTGLSGLGITSGMTYLGIESVQVSLGSAADSLSIKGTGTGSTTVRGNGGNDSITLTTNSGATTIYGGAGADTINVQGTGASATVHGDADNDTINVGSLAPATGGNLHGIRFQLSISGEDGTDTMNVDETGVTTAESGALSVKSVTGLGMTGSIIYAYLEVVNVSLGSAGDIFTVQSTHAGTTDIYGMAGDDRITVQSFGGPTLVNAGAGANYINSQLVNEMRFGFPLGMTRNFFTAESGSWTVENGVYQFSSDVAGGEALGLFHISRYIPEYAEAVATVQLAKPAPGAKASAYVVFDYQSPTDFKFAGVNASTNKVEIGRRDSKGWQVLAQAPVPGGIKPDTEYELALTIHGSTATLKVGDKASVSFTFPIRVDDTGVRHFLNDGVLGLAAVNAIGRFSSLHGHTPAVTLERMVDFSSLPSDLFRSPSSGAWKLGNGVYTGTPGKGGMAVDLLALDVAPTSYLELSTTVTTAGEGGFVFDYAGPDDFKFVTVSSRTRQVILGHRTAKADWVLDLALTLDGIDQAADHLLRLSIKGATVSVALNHQPALSYAYEKPVLVGDFGLLARSAVASFDSLLIVSDDPAFSEPAAP